MSLKEMLGLGGTNISEFEVIEKLNLAQKQNLNEVEFQLADGSKVKILLPT